MYYVIFCYFIDTQAGVVRVEHLLFHKGDANSVLPIAYCSVPRYRYCVSCTIPCGVYCAGATVYHSGTSSHKYKALCHGFVGKS